MNMNDYSNYQPCRELPGWFIATAPLRMGAGVAIWNGKVGEASRRHAIATRQSNPDAAKGAALPMLRGWATP